MISKKQFNDYFRYVIIGLTFVVGIFAIIGSGGSRYSNYNYVAPTKATETHDYEINVIDIDNNKVVGAKIDYKLYDDKRLIKSDVFVLDNKSIIDNDTKSNNAGPHKYKVKENDTFKCSIDASANHEYSSWVDYKSSIEYKVSADGYYSNSGTMSSDYGSVYPATSYSAERSKGIKINPLKKTIKIYKPIDFFSPEFILLEKDEKLKLKVIAFVDSIKVQGYLSDAYLEFRSINSSEFKGKKYLSFKFDNSITYNSLKLNKYDIAKHIFDDVIRKVLNPMNEYISDPKRFYGYDLTVIGHTKSFADKYATSQAISYRFYIPENAVRAYKNKDISGQQLIDKSIILMDDERIDLKLQ